MRAGLGPAHPDTLQRMLLFQEILQPRTGKTLNPRHGATPGWFYWSPSEWPADTTGGLDLLGLE